MSNKKTIQINPNFFSLSKNKTSKKSERKQKRQDLRMSIKPNNIKKKLIQKIKDHQKQKSEKEIKVENGEKKEFTKNFNDQLKYLEDLIRKKKQRELKKKMKRMTRKISNYTNSHQSSSQTPSTIQIHNPSIDNTIPNAPLQTSHTVSEPTTVERYSPSIKKPPPYGCLKNGKKPTYSQYKRTLKVREKINIPETPSHIPVAPSPPTSQITKPNANNAPSNISILSDRETRLEKLKMRLSTPKKEDKIQKIIKVKRTIKKYKLGKNKKKNSIGVLVKSGKTRKLIKLEHKILREKPLREIKQYLKKHNLIKTGSSAPESVLRKLYEDSFLSGDIHNKNTDNLLHNYLNKEEY